MALNIPYTFTAGTDILSAQVNANFSETLNALDKRGDTLTGNLTVSPSVTIDGVDISAAFGSAATFTGTLSVTGKVTAPNSIISLRSIDYTLPSADGTSGASLTTNGSGTLSWAGPTPHAVLSKTSTYTVATADGASVLVLCTGTFTVTLYAASGNTGKQVTVKNISTGTITIDGNASETIDGAATQAISARYTSLSLVCDGSNWHII